MTDVLIIANKWWEAAALVAVFAHPDARPGEISGVSEPISLGQNLPLPRARFECQNRRGEIWCLQDAMDSGISSSSSWEKARVLPKIVSAAAGAKLLIAFGTAAFPGENQNGAVYAGSSVFVHDPYDALHPPPDPSHHWSHPQLNQLIRSAAEPMLRKLADFPVKELQKRALFPPNKPASEITLAASAKAASIGVINVTNSADYAWADPQALARYKLVQEDTFAASDETTHGLIRLVANLPFLYFSGIANQVGHFGDQVATNLYTQNLAAANNAAVALAWACPLLMKDL